MATKFGAHVELDLDDLLDLGVISQAEYDQATERESHGLDRRNKRQWFPNVKGPQPEPTPPPGAIRPCQPAAGKPAN